MTGKDDCFGPNAPQEVSLDLPDDNLFSADDYAQMYRVAASEHGNTILTLLHKEGPLSKRDLQSRTGCDADESQAVLKELQRVALITARKAPGLEKESSHSYSITRLGEVVLIHGPNLGISILATEEEYIEATYQE